MGKGCWGPWEPGRRRQQRRPAASGAASAGAQRGGRGRGCPLCPALVVSTSNLSLDHVWVPWPVRCPPVQKDTHNFLGAGVCEGPHEVPSNMNCPVILGEFCSTGTVHWLHLTRASSCYPISRKDFLPKLTYLTQSEK